jgi:hypothetical protein
MNADNAAKKDAIMRQVKSELALANAQELMNVSHAGFCRRCKPVDTSIRSQKANEKCFEKCEHQHILFLDNQTYN